VTSCRDDKLRDSICLIGKSPYGTWGEQNSVIRLPRSMRSLHRKLAALGLLLGIRVILLTTSRSCPPFCSSPSPVKMTPLTCDNQPMIPPVDRSAIRDTLFYASDDRDTQLGGLYTSPGITNDNFHSMLEIVCQFSDTFELRDDNGQFVARDDEQLLPGNYYIVTNGRSLLFPSFAAAHSEQVPSRPPRKPRYFVRD